jgi:hypothetical protein
MRRRNDQGGSLSFYRLDLLRNNGCQAARVICYLLDDFKLVELIESLRSSALAQVFDCLTQPRYPLAYKEKSKRERLISLIITDEQE